MPEVSWTLSSGVPSGNSTKKVPYIAKQRMKEGMTEAQKQGIGQWNLMVTTLQEHGLMESKAE